MAGVTYAVRHAFHPDTLVGNIDLTLARSGPYDPTWPLDLDHLELEVTCALVQVCGWPEHPATYERAKGIAKVIARVRSVAR